MSLSKDEAARALAEIDQAGARMGRLTQYREFAPFLITWGLIWLGANAVSDFDPSLSGRAWLVGMVIGAPATLWVTVRNAVRQGARIRQAGGDAKAAGRRFALTGVTLFCFFAAMFTVMAPLDVRQGNALISLIWAFIYMGVGVWVGWRLFVIGAATAAAILFGFLFLHEHYFLWIGVVGGGALIAGGLWLRKV